jgi:hypothetical protein
MGAFLFSSRIRNRLPEKAFDFPSTAKSLTEFIYHPEASQ